MTRRYRPTTLRRREGTGRVDVSNTPRATTGTSGVPFRERMTMVSNRLITLALAAGVLAGAVACSSGEELTSTAGPPGSGTTVLRFAGTSIVAEPAGAKAATGVGAFIQPPPTPSTTTTQPPTTT